MILQAGLASKVSIALSTVVFCSMSFAQGSASDSPAPAVSGAADKSAATTEDKRAYGVLPNYRTTEASLPFAPITAKQKMTIAYKDTVDGPIFFTSAIFAGIYHLQNQNPSLGQGMKGYAKRYAYSYIDQGVGNIFAEGILPSVFHDDPRYFRKGAGSGPSRTGYALTRIFVTKSDKGTWRFNSSEFLGNGISVAFSNVYYPDTRTARENGNKFAVSLGTDALSNVLKEFWPDVKKKMAKNKNKQLTSAHL